jgi:ABC-type sugar transport system ATPase subunit
MSGEGERQPLLQLQGVRKRFHGVHALEGVSFEIRRGDVHALVGANGAGKSTLVNLLVGLVHADAGRISGELLPQDATHEEAIRLAVGD